uniref:Uncharacterized protein n=1 Tax=Setaria italica TaxID=4555 RepID=K4AGQ2_SETIT
MHSGKDQRKRIANQQNSVQGTSQNKVLALPKCRLVYSRVLFSGHSLNLILQQSCDVERSYLLASNSPLCWGRLDIHFNGSNNCLLVFHLRLLPWITKTSICICADLVDLQTTYPRTDSQVQ